MANLKETARGMAIVRAWGRRAGVIIVCTEWRSEMTNSGGDGRAVWMDLIAQSRTLKNGYNGQFYVYFISHTKKTPTRINTKFQDSA